MPWTAKTFAARHNHALRGKAGAGKAARIANAVLRRTGDDAAAIRIANARVRQYAQGGAVDAEADPAELLQAARPAFVPPSRGRRGLTPATGAQFDAGLNRGALATMLGVPGELETLGRAGLNAMEAASPLVLLGLRRAAALDSEPTLPTGDRLLKDPDFWPLAAADRSEYAAHGQRAGELLGWGATALAPDWLGPLGLLHRLGGRAASRALQPAARWLASSPMGQLSHEIAIGGGGGVAPIIAARLRAGRPIDPSVALQPYATGGVAQHLPQPHRRHYVLEDMLAAAAAAAAGQGAR